MFVTHLLVILVLGSFAWGAREGLTLAQRRAEAFNVLVFGEIGYCLTTRFIKASTFHVRALVRQSQDTGLITCTNLLWCRAGSSLPRSYACQSAGSHMVASLLGPGRSIL